MQELTRHFIDVAKTISIGKPYDVGEYKFWDFEYGLRPFVPFSDKCDSLAYCYAEAMSICRPSDLKDMATMFVHDVTGEGSLDDVPGRLLVQRAEIHENLELWI